MTVTPEAGEMVIQKNYPNSFRKASLFEHLQSLQVQELIICGAMSHMCVDATTRAANQLARIHPQQTGGAGPTLVIGHIKNYV